MVAAEGIGALSARRVAEHVGVSAGSVIHHFGSMEGLRQSCDEHVAAVIRHLKEQTFSSGPELDLTSVLRANQGPPLAGYLAAALTEDSPAVNQLVDDLVDDAVASLAHGVEFGMVLPTGDEEAARSRAVVITLWSLGALVLHRHLWRLLQADLVATGQDQEASLARYAAPAYELLSRGLFTAAEQTTRALTDLTNTPQSPTDPDDRSEGVR